MDTEKKQKQTPDVQQRPQPGSSPREGERADQQGAGRDLERGTSRQNERDDDDMANEPGQPKNRPSGQNPRGEQTPGRKS